jgi:ZIP family zinc transporter
VWGWVADGRRCQCGDDGRRLPASPRTIAFVLAFAGGAILTMLADPMMLEAFEHGGRYASLAATGGFGLAFAISELE